MNRPFLPLVTLALVLAPTALFAQSISPSFRLSQSTRNGGGGTSVSPAGSAFRLTGSLGQESTIGTSSSVRYVVQSGFWSFVGSGLVPVLLTAEKNPGNPANPDLTWSGNGSYYSVYRDTGCSDLFASGPLATETVKIWTDVAPPTSDLVCYGVLSSAPGPVAPPESVPRTFVETAAVEGRR